MRNADLNFEHALKSLDRLAVGTSSAALVRRITEIGIKEGMSLDEATKAIQARVSLSREAVEELEKIQARSSAKVIPLRDKNVKK